MPTPTDIISGTYVFSSAVKDNIHVGGEKQDEGNSIKGEYLPLQVVMQMCLPLKNCLAIN
jgi:hypothetical protein